MTILHPSFIITHLHISGIRSALTDVKERFPDVAAVTHVVNVHVGFCQSSHTVSERERVCLCVNGMRVERGEEGCDVVHVGFCQSSHTVSEREGVCLCVSMG